MRSAPHRSSRRRRTAGRPAARLTALAAALCLAQLAHAQIATAEPAPTHSAPTQPAETDSAALAARGIERLTLLDLRLLDPPTLDDYRAAAILFTLAEPLDPDDPRLPRRAAAAAFAAGDRERMLDATRRIVRLDPRDTVAQLRLLTAAVSDMQTADERLAFYTRALGPRGEAIDPAVRSRLALDAALLYREQGDAGAFAAMLATAMKLDQTNKEAASLAAQYHSDRTDDPLGRLELLVNLLYADPVDPQVHLAIARLLAEHGSFTAARRFLANASFVDTRVGPERVDSLARRLVVDWAIAGPDAALTPLNNQLIREREAAAQRIEALEAAELPTDEEIPPADILLPRDLQLLRLLSALSAVDDPAVDATIVDMARTLDLASAAAAQRAGSTQLREEDFLPVIGAFVDLQLARAITGRDLEVLAEDVARFVERFPTYQPALDPLRPWMALRTEGPAAAIALADARPDDRIASLAAAQGLESLGRTDEAIARYRATAAISPLLPIAQWSRDRIASLSKDAGPELFRSPSAAGMERFVAGVPEWIDRAVQQPSSIMLLRARAPASTLSASEPARVRIELTNTAPVPLGLGSDRTISSRMLLTPALDPPLVAGGPQPEVIELDQRLRLLPQETLVAEVPADSAFTETLVLTGIDQTLRQRWRLLQDFRAGPRGAMIAGPFSLAAETGTVRRPPPPGVSLSPAELADRLRAASPAGLPDLLVAAATVVSRPGQTSAAVIADAAIERYNAAADPERVLMLCALPHAGLAPDMAAFDEHTRAVLAAAPAEIDARVAAATLLTRVRTADDPALQAVLSAGRSPLAELAELLAARLSAPGSSYARAAGSPAALAGRGLSALRDEAAAQP